DFTTSLWESVRQRGNRVLFSKAGIPVAAGLVSAECPGQSAGTRPQGPRLRPYFRWPEFRRDCLGEAGQSRFPTISWNYSPKKGKSRSLATRSRFRERCRSSSYYWQETAMKLTLLTVAGPNVVRISRVSPMTR